MDDVLDKILKTNKKEFNFEEPPLGHFDRFETKLKAGDKKKRKTFNHSWYLLPIAASILLMFGYWLGGKNNDIGLSLADVSPKMEETQNYYLSVLQEEINTAKNQQTHENKKIIEDAFLQLDKLEIAYHKLQVALKESNEDKRIVYAMISNFQKRVEVMQYLLHQIEELEKEDKQYKNETV